jgi:hypothetical protein
MSQRRRAEGEAVKTAEGHPPRTPHRAEASVLMGIGRGCPEGTAHIGLVICGLARLSGGSLRLIMNGLGKKDGEISGDQYAVELCNYG